MTIAASTVATGTDGVTPLQEVQVAVRHQSGGRTRWGNGTAGPTDLAIEVGLGDRVYNLTLSGILDLSTADRLEAAIDAALLSDAARVRIDLDGLEFVDSTGLAAILRASRRPDGSGRLRMSRGTGEVAQLFRLTALDLVLPFD